jgi:four helix bundle protein
MKPRDLEERLVDFAVRIIRIAESLPATKAGNHLSGQLIRAGTSPALNYGEAQSAESRTDFVHKLKVALKELRETSISLKIIKRTGLAEALVDLGPTMAECDELIAIFVRSVITAETSRGRSGSKTRD